MTTIRTLTLAALLMISSAAMAEDYKTPANMTIDDRRELMAASGEYENCVRTRLQELAPKISDPRAMADAATVSCHGILTGLAEYMATENYDPNYSKYYIKQVRRDVASNALRQSLIYDARRHAEQTAP